MTWFLNWVVGLSHFSFLKQPVFKFLYLVFQCKGFLIPINHFISIYGRLSGNVSLQSTLRISPPLPYLASNMQKDLLRLGSRLDPQDSSSPMTPPSSASPTSSAISRRWRTSSPWPGANMLDQSDDTFSIEREARLHRQAAGISKHLQFLNYCSPFNTFSYS